MGGVSGGSLWANLSIKELTSTRLCKEDCVYAKKNAMDAMDADVEDERFYPRQAPYCSRRMEVSMWILWAMGLLCVSNVVFRPFACVGL